MPKAWYRYFIPEILLFFSFISDLRKQQSGAQCISFDEGYKVAKENSLHYAETSALTQDGLKELFEKAVSCLHSWFMPMIYIYFV